ncbi:MAG: hypothetical protein CL872_03255 [Dehalococcoidaceae bacterium]|nr:hypothetical protein [Dehalococcoidaceae bacterium]
MPVVQSQPKVPPKVPTIKIKEIKPDDNKPKHVENISNVKNPHFIKTKERWSIIKEYFAKRNIDYEEIFSVEGNIISKLVCLIYLLDYTSIYRAILSKTDPSPVNAINFVKERLN